MGLQIGQSFRIQMLLKIHTCSFLLGVRYAEGKQLCPLVLLGKAVKTEHVGDAGKVPDPEHPLEHADPWGCTGRALWEG